MNKETFTRVQSTLEKIISSCYNSKDTTKQMITLCKQLEKREVDQFTGLTELALTELMVLSDKYYSTSTENAQNAYVKQFKLVIDNTKEETIWRQSAKRFIGVFSFGYLLYFALIVSILAFPEYTRSHLDDITTGLFTYTLVAILTFVMYATKLHNLRASAN